MKLLVVVLLNALALPASLLVVLAFLLSPRRGLLRNLGAELGERFGFASGLPRDALWVHAASAGEVNAVEPLLRRIEGPVFVTCTTALGRDAARRLGFPAALAPLDFFPAVGAFLGRARPRALLVVETELWPTTLYLAKSRGVKLAVVNARFSPERFWRYKLARPFLGPFVALFDAVAAQSDGDAERWRFMGGRNVKAVGNLKHDRPAPKPAGLGGQGPLLVLGSTHPGEDDACYEAFKLLGPEWRLAVAPRHLERLDEAEGALRRAGLPFGRWSAGERGRVVLVDAFGVLAGLYAEAAVAFVGGTLVPVGGHNVLEPALAGCPVLFGPHTDHVAEPAALLERSGAGARVRDHAELAAKARELAAFPRCREAAKALADSLRGASGRALEHLGPVVKLV